MTSLIVPALLFLLGSSAQAQDPWGSVHQMVVDVRAPEAFKLVVTDTRLSFAWYGEHPLGAADGRELRQLSAEKGKAGEALTNIMKGPGWALFGPSDTRLAEGAGHPTPEGIQSLMEEAGWKPLREGLKAHLRLHPDDGQAWMELAFDLSRQASSAKISGTLAKPLGVSLRNELLPCLQRIAEIPSAGDIWREPYPQPFALMLLYLKFTEMDQDPELKQSARQLQASIPKLIAQDPEAEALWQVLDWTNNPEEADFGIASKRNLFASLEGVPGHPWPPLFLASYLNSFYIYPLNQLEEAYRVAEAAIATSQALWMTGRLGRAHVVQNLGAWGTAQFDSLLLQGKVEEAMTLASSLRTQAGKGWPEISTRLGNSLEDHVRYEEEHKSKGEVLQLNSQQQETLRRALHEPPTADPPAPEHAPLRLALLENAADPLAWGRLQIHPIFAPWGPAELSWQPLTKLMATRLRERYIWPQGQRWLLLQKDQVLASGPGLPKAEVLESTLRSQGVPELEQLSAFIKAHPERLDAHRARLELLRPRLPNPALEGLFLEDLEVTEEPPGSLPFEPDFAVWGPVARRLCTQTSERIRHWPFNASAWACYASWSLLDPRIQRPAALLSTLETWPHQRGLRVPGPIPLVASKAVMGVFRSQERHQDLDAWMQVLWERGLKAWVTQWASLPPLGKKAEGVSLDRAALDVKQMLAAWGDALAKQGQKARLAALRQDLENIRNGLSALLQGSAN